MPQNHMVLPHYLGRSRDMDINRKTSEVNPDETSQRDSFSSQTPPDDIPLLLPHEANGPDSSFMENKSYGLSLNEFAKESPTGYQENKSSFVDDKDNLQTATLMEAVSDSDLQVEHHWAGTQEQAFRVISANEVTQVGPRCSCHCQVSYNHWVTKILL